MNRQERLDWLCRNVKPSNWSAERPFALVALDAGHAYHAFYSDPIGDHFTRTEYLARRAELQSKPSWEDANELMQWSAQDSDGEWWFYSVEPQLGSSVWRKGRAGGEAELKTKGEVLGDWRDTLESRLDQTKQSLSLAEQCTKEVLARLRPNPAPDDMTPPFEGNEKQESDMNIDIERLAKDRAYWDECDPTSGEATHFYPGTEDWYVIEGQNERAWRPEEGLINAAYWKARKPHAIPRPKPKPKWVDGLPPVGVECLVQLAWQDMGKCRITYMGDGVYCYRQLSSGMEYAGSLRDTVFRPIPSPRDAWVDKALKLDCEPKEGMLSRADFCAALYDALASGELEVPK